MPNVRYDKGSKWERQIIKTLEVYGITAIRSAGSHSPIDIIGFNESSLFLIQAKSSENETFPDIKQLLHRTSKSKPKKMRLKIDGKIHMVDVESSIDIDSNIVKLERLKTPRMFAPARKLILWKGKGRKNYWLLEFNPEKNSWSCVKKPQII